MSNFSFSHSVFKRLVLQTRKNQGLFGIGLTPVFTDHGLKFSGFSTAGMVKELTGGYKITYHPEGPEGPALEADFTPPFRRVSMIDELEKQLDVRFPDPAELHTESKVS